ncbi:MAG: MATE family efflux transporter [Clostridia bacterium]|nr:MATE family efflux transporter [Clostridia bacterium]
MLKINKNTLKTTLNMAIPSMIESFFVAFAGLVDALMVSSLGPSAVAAVGLTSQPKFVGLSVFMAISVSVSALVARRFGEKRRDAANSVFLTSFTLVILLAAVISVIFLVFAPTIIKWCGATPDTQDMAVDYLRIIMGGMIFNCIQIGINSAQRGAGNTKITMRTNTTSNIVNIIFNYLLIGGKFGFPALGIKGAALATVLGTVVSSVMSIVSIAKKDCFISIPYIIKEKIKPTFVSLKNIVRVGYSVFAEQLLMRVGFVLTAVMAANQGTYAMAAHQVCINIMSLSFAFGDGLQTAAVALIGRSLGERNPDKAREYGSACQSIGAVISVVLAGLYFAGAKWTMNLFFKEAEIVQIGVTILYIIIVAILFQIRQVVYMGCLRGAGDTLYTAIVSTISISVVRTVAGYFFCYIMKLGIFGIWMGIFVDQLVRFTCSFIRFKKGKWVNIRI